MKYRKKPVEVEAQRFAAGTRYEAKEIAEWCGGEFIFYVMEPARKEYWSISIPTLEGRMSASFGDYIIRGVKGEFYPCKPDIFEATYESSAEETLTVRRSGLHEAVLNGLDRALRDLGLPEWTDPYLLAGHVIRALHDLAAEDR